LAPLSVAIWFVTEDWKVLLQKIEEKRAKKYGGKNLYQPIQGWTKFGESTLGCTVRLTEEEFGEEFARRYPFDKLSLIEKIKFPLKGLGEGTCKHYLGRVTEQQLGLIDLSQKLKIKFIGKEDLSNIQKLGTAGSENSVFLFEESYKILRWLLGEER